MSGAHRARIGVVGTGWWSTFVHIPALLANPDAELAGVCDLDANRAAEVGARFSVPWVTSVEELLELGLDGVIVATPHDAHFAPAAAAIDAGVDVLVEKPMTIDAGEAWELVRRATEAGVALHVGHTYPYTRHAARLRRCLREGDLGALNLVTALFATSVHQFYSGDVEFMQRRQGSQYPTGRSTYSDAVRGGGHLWTQMTHAASVVLWVTEGRARSVSAAEFHGGYGVDLSDSLAVTFEDGSIGSFAGTGSIHENPFRVEEYRFFGSRGRALLGTASGTLDVELLDGTLQVAPLEPEETELVALTSAALVASARSGAEPVVSGELGARVVELLACARRSSQSGGGAVAISQVSPTPSGGLPGDRA